MSTLHDLRATLEQRAESINDDERLTRAAAVHERVRVVRRQRLSAVAAAAVVVLVAAVTVGVRLGGPDDVQPAERWHGVEVPGEVDLAAGTYRLDGVDDIEPGEEIELPYPDGLDRRAYSLVATGLGDGSATLLVNDRPITRLLGDHQLSPAMAVTPFTLEVRLDGVPADADVGLALYRGPGAETTFSSRVGGNVLVDSATTDGTSAEVTVTGPLELISVAALCPSPSGEVTITVDGEVATEGESCSQNLLLEDGSYALLGGLGGADDPSAEHVIGVERTQPGVSLGAYLVADGPEVLGQHVPEVVEAFGRTWVLDETVPATGGESLPFGTTIDTGAETGYEERLVSFVGTGYGDVRFTSELGETCRTMGLWDVRDFCNPVLLAGDVHRLEITGDEDVEAAVVVYRPE